MEKQFEDLDNRNKKERMNKDMVAYVFPGQGSQHIGMGGDLFDEFKDITEKADSVLGYSIKELCLHNLDNQLDQTAYTQPALFIVNALCYLKKLKEGGQKPDFLAGHSLGEYNALVAADVLDFETALKIVKFRGQVMGEIGEGAMAAVIGLTLEKVKQVLRKNPMLDIEISNINTFSQIGLSGNKFDISHAKKFFLNAGARNYIVLNVSGAFHSKFMESAKKKFEVFVSNIPFGSPKIPVISNVYARPHKTSEIKSCMVKQIVSSVQWCDSMRYLMSFKGIQIEQIGPGMVLTNMIKKIYHEEKQLVREDNVSFIGENESNDKIAKMNQVIVKKTQVSAESFGDHQFKKDYKLRYCYVSGGMFRGISSVDMVIRMAKAGMLGIYGAGGLKQDQINHSIKTIKHSLLNRHIFGVNLVHNPADTHFEESVVELLLKNNVKIIEAAAFVTITPALIRYHAKGIYCDTDGNICTSNKIFAKVSRPDIASLFLSPAPEAILQDLLIRGKISKEEADFSRIVPVADEIIAESDSGGHTDGASAYALTPTIVKLRDDMMRKFRYHKKVRIGAAGGIGTPDAALAAFMLGADFIVTGSINQCTVEAGTSDSAKDLLQNMNVQDTAYVPAGDMFELGTKVQVLKKGLFFPARANKLYVLYQQYACLDEIDEKTQQQLQEKYFRCKFEDVYEEIKKRKNRTEISKAESDPRYKMLIVFKWYFSKCVQYALHGVEERKVDYQIPCGPALGAFNQWVKGSALDKWQYRHVDEIAIKLMDECAEIYINRTL